MNESKLKVTVRNKTSVLLQTECISISMVNDVGPFDILPEHANFVALIRGSVEVKDTSGKVWKQTCDRGLAKVTTNEVDVVFLDPAKQA